MKRKPWKYFWMGCLVVTLVLYGLELSMTGLQEARQPAVERQDTAASAGSSQDRAAEASVDTSSAAQRGISLDELVPDLSAPPVRDEAAQLQKPTTPVAPERGERIPPLPQRGEPSVNRLADRTADLLQNASQSGIRLIVNLFDAVTA